MPSNTGTSPLQFEIKICPQLQIVGAIIDNLEIARITTILVGALILCPVVLWASRRLAEPYTPQKPWPAKTSGTAVALMLVAFFFAAQKHHNFISIGLMLVFIAALTVLALIDARLKILPNKVTLPLLIVGLLLSLTGYTVGWIDSVVGMAGGFLLLYLPAILFSMISGRQGVGYGDFKLMAAVGAWLGWQPLPYIIFFAAISLAILGSLYLKINKLPRTTTIPFGPFLAGASIFAALI